MVIDALLLLYIPLDKQTYTVTFPFSVASIPQEIHPDWIKLKK